MPEIIADPTNNKSNSFVTLEEADAYFGSRLYADNWDNANQETKEKALIWSSLIISRSYNWLGYRRAKEQYLAFPRYGITTSDGFSVGSDEVPTVIKDATCELALALITSNPTQALALDTGVTEIKIGTIELKFEKDQITKTSGEAGVIPDTIESIFSQFVLSKISKNNMEIPVKRV